MLRRALPAAAALLALPGTAFAHHAMGGATPATFWQGLVSGLAHPVIGLDHLAFVIAAGVLAAGVADRVARLALPLVFLGCGAIGTLIHMAGLGLGPVELAIAASILCAGLLLLAGNLAPPGVLLPLFAAAGLMHGHAFAESIIGAQPGAQLAYLLGLAGIQAVIAYGAMAVTQRLGAVRPALPRRWAGLAACGVGAVAGLLALAG